MEARSSSAPTFIENPSFVKVKDYPRSIFKQCSHIATLDDSVGAFSRVPEGVVYVEDVREYIHCHIEDLGTDNIKSMYMRELMGDSRKIKHEYKHIKDLGFTGILDILEFEDEIIRYVLSRVHGELIWLDRPYKIMKEAIKAITGLSQIGQHPEKKISNDQVNKLTGATSDRRSMRVNSITDRDIRFSSMIIGYKVTQSNRLNLVSSSCIYVAHKIMRENEKIDLHGWMLDELLINLGKIKGEKKGTFQYGNLIVHLMLFFINETPNFRKRQWAFDIPVGRQLKQSIATLGSQ